MTLSIAPTAHLSDTAMMEKMSDFSAVMEKVSATIREVNRQAVRDMSRDLRPADVFDMTGGIDPTNPRPAVRALGHRLHYLFIAQRNGYSADRLRDILLNRAALRRVMAGWSA